MLDERLDAYRREGIESILAAPLTISGRGSGTVVFYFQTPHEFSDVEVATARALSSLAAAAISTAELYDEQRISREQAERSKQQSAFLAEASAAPASSLGGWRARRRAPAGGRTSQGSARSSSTTTAI